MITLADSSICLTHKMIIQLLRESDNFIDMWINYYEDKTLCTIKMKNMKNTVGIFTTIEAEKELALGNKIWEERHKEMMKIRAEQAAIIKLSKNCKHNFK